MMSGPQARAGAEGWRYWGFGPSTAARWNPGDCAWEISAGVQCARRAGHGPEKLWCKQHAKMAEEE
jgi:hypothetical protein